MLDQRIQEVAVAFELAGIGVIILGSIYATFSYLWSFAKREQGSFKKYRGALGSAILLGLEFMVAGDIIGTVTVEPTYQNIGILAIIVLIRTFLSLSLNVEIYGKWPWQEKNGAGGGT